MRIQETSDISQSNVRRTAVRGGVVKLCLGGAIIALMFLIAGCGGNDKDVPKKVVVIQGEGQAARPGAPFKKKLKIEVLGKKRKGMFGGAGTQHPVANTSVRFEVEKGSDLMVEPAVAMTDAGGGVSVNITAGKKIGDNYLKIIPEANPKAAISVRYISGVEISGGKQQAYSENSLPNPISLTVYKNEKETVPGCSVYFHISSTPEQKKKTACAPQVAKTDDNGVATTTLKMGKGTGTYIITAEVADSMRNIHIRGIEIKEYGLNLWGLVFTVLGGLAIFIYGMKLMSDGLQMVAGSKLKTVLQFFAKNRIIAVMAGALVTGVIQSSSACTVMVVGFVNAGLLQLSQAIGIIFGANIGTTITAQMISFKLGGLALPAIILGLLMNLVSKKSLIRDWGQVLLGFGLLFFGMSMMGTELKLIGKFPGFISFFQSFDCQPAPDGSMPFLSVLGAIGIGTAMTVLIQSSSATIGIALALAGSGLINFYTAVPLILGDNIGTTITAVLASLNANKPAKQTAVAHVLFNVLGATYMVVFFYVDWPGTNTPIFLYFINQITSGDVFAATPENVARHIAMAHTMFNVFNVIVFIPFIGYITLLCQRIIRIKEEEVVKIEYLEPHLLNTPSVALEQTIRSLRYMSKEAWRMVGEAYGKCFVKSKINDELVAELIRREARIDELQQEVTDYLVKLTSKELTASQSEIIPLLMHCVNDAERIADHTESIIRLTKRSQNMKKSLSEEAIKEIGKVWEILSRQAEYVIACLERTDGQEEILALAEEKKINKHTKKMEKEHIKRLRKGQCEAEAGIIFIEMLNELEKIGDNFTNIAERAPEIRQHHLNIK